MVRRGPTAIGTTTRNLKLLPGRGRRWKQGESLPCPSSVASIKGVDRRGAPVRTRAEPGARSHGQEALRRSALRPSQRAQVMCVGDARPQREGHDHTNRSNRKRDPHWGFLLPARISLPLLGRTPHRRCPVHHGGTECSPYPSIRTYSLNMYGRWYSFLSDEWSGQRARLPPSGGTYRKRDPNAHRSTRNAAHRRSYKTSTPLRVHILGATSSL